MKRLLALIVCLCFLFTASGCVFISTQVPDAPVSPTTQRATEPAVPPIPFTYTLTDADVDEFYRLLEESEKLALESTDFDILSSSIGLRYLCRAMLLNKGYTQEQEYETLKKLKNAGIRYIALLMGGVGGYDYSNEHVIETAKLLNTYPPKMVSIITTGIVSGTKLDEMAKNGEFKQLCEKDVILEEMELIEKLNLPDNTYFFGHHNNNLAPVSGYFSDKEELISDFEYKLREIPQNVLESKIKREYL